MNFSEIATFTSLCVQESLQFFKEILIETLTLFFMLFLFCCCIFYRVCVEVLLPAEEHFRVDACLVNISTPSTTTTSTARREALHVQSTSYWAPANIGPYSQAVKVRIT